ncbi:MAG: hypothetical protein IJY25_05130 [Bacilli bacterium]|nr:hypothetical protein [Bacilli bacterium]
MKKNVLKICLFLLISFIFIDFVGAETYTNNYTKGITSCGNNLLTDIPTLVPQIISIIYTVIQIAVPVVLVIMGSLDLMKGITAGKDDEIKKGQQMFIKRLIAAALIFFVFIIVKLVVSLANDESRTKTNKIMNCANCFIRNECGN